MNRGEDYFSPFLVDLSLPSIVIVRDVARVKTNLYYIIKDISHISHIRESRFSFSLYVHCLLFSKWNKPRPSLAKCLKKTFRGVLLFDCYIYLGLHEKCELAQLALFNITTFYPSETFICKVCFFGKTLSSSDLWRQSWWTNFKLPAQRQGVINWGSPSCGEEWNYKKHLLAVLLLF